MTFGLLVWYSVCVRACVRVCVCVVVIVVAVAAVCYFCVGFILLLLF